MNPRRKFLKNLAGASIGAFFVPFGGDTLVPPKSEATRFNANLDGEDFWKMIREHFPLVPEMHYLNAATRGPQTYGVLETLDSTSRYFAETGIYKELGNDRKDMAQLLDVDEDEFAFTRNATEGINIVANSLSLKKDDEVIMTTHEHVGNALPWLNRVRRTGIIIRPFEPAMTAEENLNRIKALVGKRTRAIAVPHVTSPTGIVMPAKEIAAFAAKHNLFSFFDGAQAAGHIRLNLKDINCDFYAGCFHKWYLGPEGTGFLYVKKGRLDDLDPVHVGAYSDTGWEISMDQVSMDRFVDSARLFEYGTHSESLAKGAVKAVGFLHSIGMERVEARCRHLSDYLRDSLEQFGDAIEMLTPREPRSHAGILGFRLNGRSSHDFFNYARANKYRIRFVPESGLNSLRISTHVYNNEESMDGFVEVLREFMAKY